MQLTPEQKKNIRRWRNRFRQAPDGLGLFARRMLRMKPTPGQDEIFRGYMKSGRLAVRAGHGVGKTVCLVALLYHRLYCHDYSRVTATAPTQHQVFDILWTEAAKWRRKAAPDLRMFCEWTKTRINVRGHGDTWYAHAIPSTSPDALAGIHDERLLYLIDEAPGVQEHAFEVIEGALTQENNAIAMIGNPTKVSGFFYKVFQRPGEWSTHKLSSENSPLVTRKYIERMAERFGKDSNVYRVRVLGEFPIAGDDSILSLDLVEYAMNRERSGDTTGTRAIGCDVARYGHDRTVIYGRISGDVVFKKVIASSDLTYVSDQVKLAAKEIDPHVINIDAGGIGAGVADEVARWCREHEYIAQVNGIENQQRAVEDTIYENAGTEMYFGLREALKWASIPRDDDLLFELTERTFDIHPKSLRYIIEDKESLRRKMKRKRIEIRSPDKADALALCFYFPEAKAGTVGGFA